MQYRISTTSREINKLTAERTYVSLKDHPQSLFYVTGEVMHPIKPVETFGVEGLKIGYSSQFIIMDIDLVELEEYTEIHITYRDKKHEEPLPNHPITVDDRTVIWWETGGDEPPHPDDNIPTIEVPLQRKMYYWVTCTNCGITTGITPTHRKMDCPSCNIHMKITLGNKQADEYTFVNPFVKYPVRYTFLQQQRPIEEPPNRLIFGKIEDDPLQNLE